MIIGIGCDLIEIARINKALDWGSFKTRVYTPEEIAYCESRGQQAAASFAARFAAKEAVLKALGTGLRGGSMQEICVTNDDLGRPGIILTGYFLELAWQLGVMHIHLSLSHSRDMAMAYVVMEDGK